MGKHDVVDQIRIALRDGLTAPDRKTAAALIDRIAYDVDAEHGYDDGFPWDLAGEEAYRALLRKDLKRALSDLRRGEVEYEGVGFDEMPQETAHARRLRAAGVLKAAGLVAYEPVITWVPWGER